MFKVRVQSIQFNTQYINWTIRFDCFILSATAPETVSPPIMGYTPPSSSILETILTGNRVVSGKTITPY